MFRLRRASLIAFVSTLVILIVIISALICKVSRTFVLMCAAIVLESSYDIVDVIRGVFVELLVVTKDDDGDIDLTQDGKFVRFLE